MTKNNKEAVKSSVMAGVAFGVMVCGVLTVVESSHILCPSLGASVVGFGVGLWTTWYPNEE